MGMSIGEKMDAIADIAEGKEKKRFQGLGMALYILGYYLRLLVFEWAWTDYVATTFDIPTPTVWQLYLGFMFIAFSRVTSWSKWTEERDWLVIGLHSVLAAGAMSILLLVFG